MGRHQARYVTHVSSVFSLPYILLVGKPRLGDIKNFLESEAAVWMVEGGRGLS